MTKETKEYFELPCGCKFPILGGEKEDDGYPSTEIDYYNLPDCPITWDLLRSGETLGVFQLDTNTGQKWAAKVKPENIGEVADLVALVRPGANALMEGVAMNEHYVLRKFGQEENKCQFEILEPILSRTYNVLLYQEQIISIGILVAGFSLTEADDLRKGVGSKDAEKLKKVGEIFVDKAEKHGVVSRAEAEEIFNWIKSSARYLFSSLHSYGYSATSYATAYAKAHFPLRFGQAYMTYATDGPLKKKREVIKDIIQDGKKQGYYVQPPSFLNLFRNDGRDCLIDNTLYYGIANIRGVGGAALKKLQQVVKEFKPVEDIDWPDVLFFISPKINKTAIDSLVKAGCFNYLKISRKRALFHLEKFRSLTKTTQEWCTKNYHGDLISVLEKAMTAEKVFKTEKIRKKTEEILDSLRNPPYNLEDNPSFNMRHERELLGICLSVDVKDVVDNSICNTNVQVARTSPFQNMIIPCIIQSAKYFKIKNGPNKGKDMCSLVFADDFGEVEAVIWSDTLEDCEPMIFEGNTVIVFADPSNRKGQIKVNKLCQT